MVHYASALIPQAAGAHRSGTSVLDHAVISRRCDLHGGLRIPAMVPCIENIVVWHCNHPLATRQSRINQNFVPGAWGFLGADTVLSPSSKLFSSLRPVRLRRRLLWRVPARAATPTALSSAPVTGRDPRRLATPPHASGLRWRSGPSAGRRTLGALNLGSYCAERSWSLADAS